MPAPAHRTAPSPARTRVAACERERGFTLVEILVALVIGVIIIAIAIISFNGARSTVSAKEGIAAGSSYAQAMAQYAADNANRAPLKANMLPNNLGPRNLLGKSYMRSAPDGVGAGRVGVSLTGTTNCAGGLATIAGAGKQTTWVSYCRYNTAGTAADSATAPDVQSPNYGIRVAARANSSASWTDAKASVCWIGQAAPGTPSPKRCG